MSGFGAFIFLAFIVGLAILFLKGFDRISGRGSKQVSSGIKNAVKDAKASSQAQGTPEEQRIPCPYCAEKILPAAKICPFCKSQLSPTQEKIETTAKEQSDSQKDDSKPDVYRID